MAGSDLHKEIESLRREVERLRVLASKERGLLEAVLHHSPHGIIVSDATGKLVLHNRAAERIWAGSASAEDVEGWGRYRAYHPDGRPYEPGDWAMARCLSRGEIVETEEVRFQRFDDTFGVLLGSCAPIHGPDGKLEGALSVFADITRFKEMEQDLAARERELAEVARRSSFLAEASAVLSSSLDVGETLHRVAALSVPALCDWCAVEVLDGDGPASSQLAVAHVDPRKVEAARELRRRYPPDPAGTVGVAKVMRTGEPELIAEISDEMLAQAARDEEHARLLRLLAPRAAMIVPLTARGRTLGALSFVVDGSGRRFDAADLQTAVELGRRAGIALDNARLYEEARAAVAARDDFLSIAGHELKTPLSAMQLQIELLVRLCEEGGDRAQLEDKARKANRSLVRFSALVHRLLDVTRITSGRLDLVEEQVDLAEIARERVARMAEELAQAGCAATLHAPSPVVGRWDRLRLEQVVDNLLQNAAKYGRGSPVEVRVEGGHDRALLVVRDQGVGIAREDLARVFERFERAVSARQFAGLGLGLWITRQIVEAHGGTIRVESTPGEGATFVVELPRRD